MCRAQVDFSVHSSVSNGSHDVHVTTNDEKQTEMGNNYFNNNR